jgi:hypothetical protein
MSHRRPPFALLGLVVVALLLVLAPAASAKSRDRNHDRIPDKWETAHHLSLRVNQAKKDQDHDGLNNRGEFRAGTDPRDADTDNDGTKDGREDGGTIVSFTPATATTPGTLTIKLFQNDKPVEGTVDAGTEVKCEGASPSPATTASVRDHGGDGSGDNSGSDDDNPGQPAGTGDANDANDNTPQAGDDRGQDQGDDDANEHQNAACGTDQLKPGTVVHEADLSTTPSGLHFDEIKLGAQPAASPTA